MHLMNLFVLRFISNPLLIWLHFFNTFIRCVALINSFLLFFIWLHFKCFISLMFVFLSSLINNTDMKSYGILKYVMISLEVEVEVRAVVDRAVAAEAVTMVAAVAAVVVAGVEAGAGVAAQSARLKKIKILVPTLKTLTLITTPLKPVKQMKSMDKRRKKKRSTSLVLAHMTKKEDFVLTFKKLVIAVEVTSAGTPTYPPIMRKQS